jgi:hypothetical protein
MIHLGHWKREADAFSFPVGMETATLVCVECGAVAPRGAEEWRLYRIDAEGEEPELAAWCPECATREFD